MVVSRVIATSTVAAYQAVALVFSDAGTQLSSGLDAVALDATIKRKYRTTSTITQHPIESGSNVSDHIHDNPDELQIDGIISNTPVSLLASALSPSRAEDEYDKLLELKTAKQPITIYTTRREYEDYVIASLDRTEYSAIGDSVEVSIGLQSVRLVESKATTGLITPRPKGVQKPKQNLGKKTKKAANAAQSKSILTKLLGW